MQPNNQPTPPDGPQQWNYTSGQLINDGEQTQPATTTPQMPEANQVLVSWQASEFIENDKNASWYALVAGGTVVIAVLMFVIIRQLISSVVILLMGIVFAVYGSAKPRILQYDITPQELRIGGRVYDFNSIKSFCIIDEGAMPYIQLLLQRRLSVPLIVYVDPTQIDDVAEVLGQFVPYDQKKRDIADKVSSRLHF